MTRLLVFDWCAGGRFGERVRVRSIEYKQVQLVRQGEKKPGEGPRQLAPRTKEDLRGAAALLSFPTPPSAILPFLDNIPGVANLPSMPFFNLQPSSQ